MTEPFAQFKLWLVAVLDTSRDALHVHLGLLVLFGAALVLRRPLASPVPWLVVLAAELVNEAGDFFLNPDPADWLRLTVHDFLNTMLWPTALLLLARRSWLSVPDRRHARHPPDPLEPPA